MKITRLRAALLGCAVFATLFAGASQQASAATYVDVRVGPNGPPPMRVEHAWKAPYRGAVWIPGAYSWNHGRYVWVGGYYSYPPRPGGHWVAPVYTQRGGAYYYRAGRWVY